MDSIKNLLIDAKFDTFSTDDKNLINATGVYKNETTLKTVAFSSLCRSLWVHNLSQDYQIITKRVPKESSPSRLQKVPNYFSIKYIKKRHRQFFLCFEPNFKIYIYIDFLSNCLQISSSIDIWHDIAPQSKKVLTN